MSRLARNLRRWIDSSGLFFWRRSISVVASTKPQKAATKPVETKSLGTQGEVKAAEFLKGQGYRILAHSHRQRLGEIDLIALDGKCIVFVEVKTWASDEGGDPSMAVDRPKQQKITRTALSYLKRHRLLDQPARFDVISIVWNGSQQIEPKIRHFQSAFEATGRGQLYS